MRTVKATEMKQRLGQCLDYALASPLMVEKSGRPFVVVVSVDEYERLLALEDAYWGQRAKEAEKSGWASDAEVSAIIGKFKSEKTGA